MTAYYNEIDPYAAQWLRNIKVSDQDRLAGSAYDPIICGMSGREPKPFGAISCSPRTFSVLVARVQGDVQSLQLGSRRKLRIRVGPRGLERRIFGSDCLAAASPWSERDRLLPLWGGDHGKCAPTRRCSRGGKHLSIATYYVGLVRSRTMSRKRGMNAHPIGMAGASAFSIEPCTFQSSISGEHENPASPRRTQRISAANLPRFAPLLREPRL